jgi:hypothetical protein
MSRLLLGRAFAVMVGLTASFATPGLAVAHGLAHHEHHEHREHHSSIADTHAMTDDAEIGVAAASDKDHDHPCLSGTLSTRTTAVGPATLSVAIWLLSQRDVVADAQPIPERSEPPPDRADSPPPNLRAPPASA